MSSTHIHPRRRAAPSAGNHVTSPSSLPGSDSKPCLRIPKSMPLQKGATFHSPTSPSDDVDDPVISIRKLPPRSPTCPKALDDLLSASEARVANLIECFDRTLSGLSKEVDADLEGKDALPVPSFFVQHAASSTDLMDVDKKQDKDTTKSAKPVRVIEDHHHGSDSGIGSSVSDGVDDERDRDYDDDDDNSSVYSSVSSSHSTISKPARAVLADGHRLSEYATKKIKQHIVKPILSEKTLKEYHPLIKELPQRIGDRKITCLRDLEKTLIFLAPTKASSAASYLSFCETSIQCIHTTVEHLNELDQRRPTDRPYTNNYFVDLVQQVRQYASIMARSRQKKAAGKPLDEQDYSPDEKLHLRGGPSENGRPAELVREKEDGKMIPIDAGRVDSDESLDSEDTLIDEDVRRSMARKRKCDQGKEEYRACRECGKVFTRPCDLTKHEKTHSRPFKCPDPECKYHTFGWPTEKECDRHYNDKHSNAPALYRCLYKPCTYTSKRESNCKQHMEKAHGWEYKRSKSKKGQTLIPTTQTPSSSSIPTPNSSTAFPSLNSPISPFEGSPALSSNYPYSPRGSVDTTGSVFAQGNITVQGNANDIGHPVFNDQELNLDGFNDGFNALLSPQTSAGRQESLDTPISGYSPMSHESVGMPNTNSFEDTFNFAELHGNNPWPPMADFFPQYNIQQPTPAWSDFNCDFNFGGHSEQPTGPFQGQVTNHNGPEFTPGGQSDLMFCDPQDPAFESNDEGFDDSKDGDFTLFREAGPTGGESSAAGASAGHASMFPELVDNIGGQFGQDPMFDGMSDGSISYDDTMY